MGKPKAIGNNWFEVSNSELLKSTSDIQERLRDVENKIFRMELDWDMLKKIAWTAFIISATAGLSYLIGHHVGFMDGLLALK